MTTKRDSRGDCFGQSGLIACIPADVPASQFWTLTLYSENTRRAYENRKGTVRSANLDSRLKDLKRNADGSVDLHIGPRRPPDSTGIS
jgi:hypothetical protein